MTTGKLIYEGSVKNLRELGSDRLEFEYTDAYSVFDWGRMPDALPHKGEALAALGSYFFCEAAKPESWRKANLGASKWLATLAGNLKDAVRSELAMLESKGLPHHYLERSASNRLVVRKVSVTKPAKVEIGGQTFYEYSGRGWSEATRLIPLEVVFRLGVPKGSSLLERMTPAYARQLGLGCQPTEGSRLDRPVVEFFSKLEQTDRFLTWEQALNYSGLSVAQFTRLVARSMALAVWLAEIFEAKGLELWDGKFEWALDQGELMLVDSIGPDELRLLDPATGTQISKEFLRLYYRQTPWFEATKQAKTEAATDPNLDWKHWVTARTGGPEPLSAEFRDAATALYPSLALAVCGENPGKLGVSISQLLERIRKCLAK